MQHAQQVETTKTTRSWSFYGPSIGISYRCPIEYSMLSLKTANPNCSRAPSSYLKDSYFAGYGTRHPHVQHNRTWLYPIANYSLVQDATAHTLPPYPNPHVLDDFRQGI